MTSLGVGGGIFSSFPTTPWLGRARTRAFLSYVVARCWWRAFADFTWCMGAWPPPHPSIGSRTRATNCQYNFQFSIIISKFKCQTWISNGRSIHGRCLESYKWNFKCNLFQTLYYWNLFQRYLPLRYSIMFAYTTSDVYLTTRFKCWNLCIKYSWNYNYS